MAVNELSFSQSAAFLTDLYEQATGQKPSITVVDSGSFTTVAQMVLKTGYDTVINSISQVLSRTIFSVRPYTAKFKGIFVDSQRFGNITRKINFIDGDVENDDREPLTDGQSVDQWTINKPKILQTNFYGFTKYQRHVTIFRDQLDVAFSSPSEFSRFISGVMQNVVDQLEQIKEAEARNCLINFIAGKAAGDAGNVINVLQAYKDETGVTLTPTTMYADSNYIPFMKWLYSYINGLTQKLAERTIKYHINVTGKEVHRHTPASDLKAYMSARAMNAIDSIGLPSIFGADRLKMIDFEPVVYWQNIDDAEKIIATPTVLLADGTLEKKTSTTVENIIGVLFDRDALGITRKSEWMMQTGFNARGGYNNIFYHFSVGMWNDFTENGIVLVADTVS